MQFGYEVIDDSLPCGRLGICQPTDLTGNGRSDIHAAEIGLGKREDESRTPSFRDQGDGEFVELLIHHGTPTHETKEIDMNDYGRTDIVSKSYGPDHYADIWYNEG